MINNFDEMKKQLSDLAGIINSFKSEAVQLRIVELIFQGVHAEDAFSRDISNKASEPSRARGRRKPPGNKAAEEPVKTTTSRPGRSGPATVLAELISEGFFKEKRALKAIIEHCSKKKAHKFKANELSGPLARFVRNHRLDRDENKDGQYEYFKK